MITLHRSLLNEDLIIVTIKGIINYDKFKSINIRYYDNPSKYLLLDLRLTDLSEIPSNQMDSLINDIGLNAHKRPPGAKTALLVSGDLEFGISRMVQAFAEIHELKIEFVIFYEYQDAMNWFNLNSLNYFE